MSINRKECRKYLSTEPKMSTNNTLIRTESLKYILRTSVRNICGQRTLIIYLHLRHKAEQGDFAPRLVLFQTKTSFASLVWEESGVSKWRMSNLNDIIRDISQAAFYLKKDAERVKRFCGKGDSTALEQLRWLQYEIKEREAKERRIGKERELQHLMRQIPRLPHDFKIWALREKWPSYLFYKSCRRNQTGYCSACGREIGLHGARHNRLGVCPHCGREVHFKSTGLCNTITVRQTLLLVQKTCSEQVVVRIFKAYLTQKPNRKPELTLWESARQYIRQANGRTRVDSYYTFQDHPQIWRKGIRPYAYQNKFIDQMYGKLYCNNLPDELSETPWKYAQLKEFYKSDEMVMNAATYLTKYVRYPFVEYLVKLRLYNMATDIIYGSNRYHTVNFEGTNLCQILGIGKDGLGILQKINGDTLDLYLYHILTEAKLSFDIPFRDWIRKNNVSDYSFPKLAKLLRYTHPDKLIRYLEQEQAGFSRKEDKLSLQSLLSDYADYLDDCKELHYDMNNKRILFPQNLLKAHDETAVMVKVYRDERCDRWLAKTYEQRKEQYGFENADFAILPLKALEELQAESAALGHCIKNYAGKIASGDCMILFLRRSKALEEPFYTMEVQWENLIQIQGLAHCAPTPEVEAFVEQWKAMVLLRKTA